MKIAGTSDVPQKCERQPPPTKSRRISRVGQSRVTKDHPDASGVHCKVFLEIPRIRAFAPDGSAVEFRHGEICTVCDQECKRSVVDELRNGEVVVYVGDGYSDRCAALAADRVFARRELAQYLDADGVGYEPFDDFVSVRGALGL